jgi:transposase
MDEGEIIKQLRELVEQLKHENELLKAKVIELEARLVQYENAHTPPSLRRGGNRKKDQDKKNNGKPGKKIGHKGVTRPYAAPDEQVEVTMDSCPDCGEKLGSPFEEIPVPQPIIVCEYIIAHSRCPCCLKEVAAKDPGCPHEGKFRKM